MKTSIFRVTKIPLLAFLGLSSSVKPLGSPSSINALALSLAVLNHPPLDMDLTLS